MEDEDPSATIAKDMAISRGTARSPRRQKEEVKEELEEHHLGGRGTRSKAKECSKAIATTVAKEDTPRGIAHS